MNNNTKPKHITFFITSMGGGGAERAMLNLAISFYKKGHKVNFFLILKEGPYLKHIPKGIGVSTFKPVIGKFRVPQSVIPLAFYLRKERPNVIISAMNECNIIAITSKFLSRIKAKIIISEQNFISLSINGPVRRKITHCLIKFLYPKASFITAASKGIADDLCKTAGISKKKVKVLYNPIIDDNVFKKSKERVGHPFFREKTEGVLLGLGRLSHSKNYSYLIKAFSILKKNRNVRLIILGEGGEKDNLKKMITELGLQKFISVPGFADNPFAYLAKADIFVHSAKYEGLGNVLVESMACGTPVVSVKSAGPVEALDNGKYGKLVPVDDAPVFAKAIEETLDNPPDPKMLRKRAEYFSVENSAKQYLELINTRNAKLGIGGK